MAIGFSFGSLIDAARTRAHFLEHSRVRLADLLAAGDAQRLHDHLHCDTRWTLVRHDFQGHFEAPPNVRDHWGRDSEREFHERAYHDVRDSMRYLYEKEEVRSAGSSTVLQAFGQFVNSTSVITLMRDLTGIDDIAAADVIATAYRKGHFLTRHMDGDREGRRRVAYVLNLTPVWYPEWGGHLQFLGDGGQSISETYIPAFNHLALFRVPQMHGVSVVAPYATAARYSITGWFRAL